MGQQRGSVAGFGFVAILIAIVFILLPTLLPAMGIVSMNGPTQAILAGFGVILLLVGATIVTITRLYVKTSADQAFVRTGMGGQEPIIDGGALVIPVVHEIVPVSLQTMRLDVDRSAHDALITGDNLRADVAAEFYIKVQKIREHILAAATSLGERSVDAESVKHLVNQKLVSALRTVAATRPLHELHTKRDEFAQAVQVIVEKDLAHNGLTLESVTISRLDQTPPTAMRGEDNVFDAQGLRTIAEITQRQRIERNKIEREADQRVTEQDVTRDQFVYEQEVARANAGAQKDRNIEIARAQAQQEADTFAAEAQMEAERQAVRTVEITQTAERDKAKAIIEAQAEFEKRRLQEQVQADVAAYAVVKAAEGGESAAAKDAAARLTLAQAQKEAMALQAEGERAAQMVPVDVERQRVEVERARVTVERQELENKAQFESIARGLQVDLARIDAEKQIRIAAAQAFGEAMASAKMTVWGDPDTASRMAESFFKGQQFGFLTDGLMESTPNGVKDAIGQVGAAIQQMTGGKNGDAPASGAEAEVAQSSDREK